MQNPTITNRIDVLNVESWEWEKLQLLEGRASMGSTVVQDRFVVFAGGEYSKLFFLVYLQSSYSASLILQVFQRDSSISCTKKPNAQQASASLVVQT